MKRLPQIDAQQQQLQLRLRSVFKRAWFRLSPDWKPHINKWPWHGRLFCRSQALSAPYHIDRAWQAMFSNNGDSDDDLYWVTCQHPLYPPRLPQQRHCNGLATKIKHARPGVTRTPSPSTNRNHISLSIYRDMVLPEMSWCWNGDMGRHLLNPSTTAVHDYVWQYSRVTGVPYVTGKNVDVWHSEREAVEQCILGNRVREGRSPYDGIL